MTLREAALCPLRTRRGAYIKLRKLLTIVYTPIDEVEHYQQAAVYNMLVARVVAAGYFDSYECMMIARHETVLRHSGELEI